MKPTVLFVGRTRQRIPLSESQARKWGALGDRLELKVMAGAADSDSRGDDVFELWHPVSPRALDPLAFYGSLPLRVARRLRSFRPDAVITQSPYEAAAVLAGRRLARVPAKVVVDVHGDWRTFTRLYGSPLRRLLALPADALASWALRRADGVRTLSGFTTGLVGEIGVEPTRVFPAFMDIAAFVERPPAALPARPRLLFVGVLERYKNVDGLARAWRAAAPRLPGVTLTIVGDGSLRDLVEPLLADLREQTVWKRGLSAREVADELDRATALVLPSRSEGLPRIVVEALARGRPVVAAPGGGIPDLIVDGENGLLVPPEDDEALAAAMVRIARDAALAERLAAAARPSVEPWLASPDDYAERVHDLVGDVVRSTQPAASVP